jgi:probable rRNA maturation factor
VRRATPSAVVDLEISVVNGQRRHAVDARRLRRFLEVVAGAMPPPRGRTLALRLVSDGSMRELNRRFRGRDACTDVLSFPGGRAQDEAGRLHLGDLAIAVGTARRQARAAGHSLGRELRLLALHGYLHLLGYDHETDDGTMRRLERRLVHRLVDRHARRPA